MIDSLFPYHASFYPDVDEPIPFLGVICNAKPKAESNRKNVFSLVPAGLLSKADIVFCRRPTQSLTCDRADAKLKASILG